MAKGFTKEEGEALNSAVREIVERAINALQAIGMTYASALQLLVIQATIRMEDTAEVKRWLRCVEDGLQPPGGLS